MQLFLEQEDLISILVSIFCGTIIGFEREYSNKSADFRTMILICLAIPFLPSFHGMAAAATTVLLPISLQV